jgi:hypothetical protein
VDIVELHLKILEFVICTALIGSSSTLLITALFQLAYVLKKTITPEYGWVYKVTAMPIRPIYWLLNSKIYKYIRNEVLFTPLEFIGLLKICIKKPKGLYIPCTAYTHALTGSRPVDTLVYTNLASKRAWWALIRAKIKARALDKTLNKDDEKGIIYYIKEGEKG